jgi:hypothetical protein
MQIAHVDPMSDDPPPVDATADNQHTAAPPPWELGDRLRPRADSSLIDGGVDPTSVPGLTAEMRSAMASHLSRDVAGAARPSEGAWDVGAYEGGYGSR